MDDFSGAVAKAGSNVPRASVRPSCDGDREPDETYRYRQLSLPSEIAAPGARPRSRHPAAVVFGPASCEGCGSPVRVPYATWSRGVTWTMRSALRARASRSRTGRLGRHGAAGLEAGDCGLGHPGCAGEFGLAPTALVAQLPDRAAELVGDRSVVGPPRTGLTHALVFRPNCLAQAFVSSSSTP
jgi:hypothetical protein